MASGSDPPQRPPTGGQRKGKGIAIDPPRRRRPNIIRIGDAGHAMLSSTQRPHTSMPTQPPARSAPTQAPARTAPAHPPARPVSTPHLSPIHMIPNPGFQQTPGTSSCHFVPETMPDAHMSDHDYSTGHTPDQTQVEQDGDEQEEVEQQEVDQEVVDDIEMLHDGRVVIRPAGNG